MGCSISALADCQSRIVHAIQSDRGRNDDRFLRDQPQQAQAISKRSLALLEYGHVICGTPRANGLRSLSKLHTALRLFCTFFSRFWRPGLCESINSPINAHYTGPQFHWAVHKGMLYLGIYFLSRPYACILRKTPMRRDLVHSRIL